MREFTGERVIPGLVEADLFNEHFGRYRFAATFISPDMRVLDAGCGSGYGSAELRHARAVTGVDIAFEAVEHAWREFGGSNIRFAAASCEALPFADASFDLIVAFEVIEHVADYRALLSEARRTLKSGGVLLVSTPNRVYYAESRAEAGPNPFHTREFDFAEFEAAIEPFFRHSVIWMQNHADTIVFSSAEPAESAIEAVPGGADPATAHFFLAVLSDAPLERHPLFAWLPSTGNTLRERERHIGKLESELARKDEWLKDALARHESLERAHEELIGELRDRNEWAAGLDRRIADRNARIAALQEELAARLAWVRDLERQIAAATAEIERLNAEIERLNAEMMARTAWAEKLDARRAQAEAQLAMLAQSKWVRLGKKLHVGLGLDGR